MFVSTSADGATWAAPAVVNHIAVDGYSFARLLRWVADSYTADLVGEPPPESPFHEPGPAAVRDAEAERADAQFWADYVDTARPPTLSSAAPAPARDRALRITRSLPPRTSATDRGWAESMMGTLALYLAAYSGEPTVTLGVPWANRRLGAPPTMEPEVTIMPLRLSVAPTMTIDELIANRHKIKHDMDDWS